MILEPNYTLNQFKYEANRNFKSKEGYQRFEIDFVTKTLLPFDKLANKSPVLKEIIHSIAPGRSILDLGCDKGYFSWLAVTGGAISVTANDVNWEVLEFLRLLSKIMNWPIKPVMGNLFKINSNISCDYVLALAMIHQVVDFEMEQIIQKIRLMCKAGAIIEFCEDYREKLGPTWNLNRFVNAAKDNFSSIRCVAQYKAAGKFRGTRYVYDLVC